MEVLNKRLSKKSLLETIKSLNLEKVSEVNYQTYTEKMAESPSGQIIQRKTIITISYCLEVENKQINFRKKNGGK